MKKSMAVILLGSALLLPTTTVQKLLIIPMTVDNNKVVHNVQYYVYKGDVTSYNPEQINKVVSKYANGLEKYFGENIKVSLQTSTNPWSKNIVVKPQEQAKPEVPAKPVQPAKPVEQPKPAQPTKPAEQPTPAQPAKPVEQPKPSQPANPVEQEKPAQTGNISAIEQAVLDLTNAERQKAGLKPLQIDNNLMNSARQKSKDMATNKYFSHTSPTYGSPFDQMKANGVTYRSAAENIAMGQRSAEEVVKGWMDSPGHRQNILTPNFTHIGIGYDANGNYWTQQFIQK